MKCVNGFDIDGVLTVGIRPGKDDIIISGRSFEEYPETKKWLEDIGIKNEVYLNPLPFNQKTRETSGEHKAKTIKALKYLGVHIVNFFEDDEIQKAVIEKECPEVKVVHVVHTLTEKENVRHLEDTVERIQADTTPKIIQDLFQFPYNHFGYSLLEYSNSNASTLDSVLLDIACGNCVQTPLLEPYFKGIISMDVEPTKDFVIKASILDIPLPDKYVDYSFSFETIEHIEYEDQLDAIKELLRVTKKCVIIGSVNQDGPDTIEGHEIWKAKNGNNPYHLGELTAENFMILCASVADTCEVEFFGSVYRNGQFEMVPGLGSDRYCNYAVIKVGE